LPPTYKTGAAIIELLQRPSVIFGGAIATEKGIESKGMDVAMAVLTGGNAFGKPSRHNSKGKPYQRVQLADGTADDVLQQDLVVYGWLSAELSGLWYSIQENELTTAGAKADPPSEVFIDYIHDFLPDDLSGFKARVPQEMLLGLSGGHVHLIGRPDVSDTHQRDLLTDNAARLLREINDGTWSASPSASDVQRLFRITNDANAI